jgi:hypothetical protein
MPESQPSSVATIYRCGAPPDRTCSPQHPSDERFADRPIRRVDHAQRLLEIRLLRLACTSLAQPVFAVDPP